MNLGGANHLAPARLVGGDHLGKTGRAAALDADALLAEALGGFWLVGNHLDGVVQAFDQCRLGAFGQDDTEPAGSDEAWQADFVGTGYRGQQR
ncbi:hypothetical protein D3C76_1627280 [compost metagenome]